MVVGSLTYSDSGVAGFMMYIDGQVDLAALIQHCTAGQSRLFLHQGEIAASYIFLCEWRVWSLAYCMLSTC